MKLFIQYVQIIKSFKYNLRLNSVAIQCRQLHAYKVCKSTEFSPVLFFFDHKLGQSKHLDNLKIAQVKIKA